MIIRLYPELELPQFRELTTKKWEQVHPGTEDSLYHSVVSDSCDPMDCSPPCSSVLGILQARILEWVAISFSRLTNCLKTTKVMPVRPLMTTLKMTVRDDCAVSGCCPPPTLPVNSLTPCFLAGVGGGWGVSLWTDVHHPPLQLLASEIKQTFLSTNLVCLLAFEWQAAGLPTSTFQ